MTTYKGKMKRGGEEVIDILRAADLMLVDEILAMLSMSRTMWFAGIRKGIHPKPMKFGNRSLWKLERIKKLYNMREANKKPSCQKSI